jgi:hypothetical protein
MFLEELESTIQKARGRRLTQFITHKSRGKANLYIPAVSRRLRLPDLEIMMVVWLLSPSRASTMSATSCPQLITHKGKGKGKAIPLQAWAGSVGSRRLRLPDLKTIGT